MTRMLIFDGSDFSLSNTLIITAAAAAAAAAAAVRAFNGR